MGRFIGAYFHKPDEYQLTSGMQPRISISTEE